MSSVAIYIDGSITKILLYDKKLNTKAIKIIAFITISSKYNVG